MAPAWPGRFCRVFTGQYRRSRRGSHRGRDATVAKAWRIRLLHADGPPGAFIFGRPSVFGPDSRLGSAHHWINKEQPVRTGRRH